MVEIYDFGFTMVDHKDEDETLDLERKLQAVENLVVPLLNNLMRDPKKDIHWPDRDKKLSKFKKDLLSLTSVKKTVNVDSEG